MEYFVKSEPNKNPYISVLIVSYNGRNLLKECLDSIEAQTFRDFEIVFVDNGSVDDSANFVLENYPDVTVTVCRPNRGWGVGSNFGYPHCRGEYVYFLNNDVALEKNALEELASASVTHPEIGIFASFLIKYRDRSRADSAGDTIYTCGKSFSFANYPVSMFTSPRLITSACAAAALYSRRVLDKIGLFDEDFFLNYEDLDLSFRAQHAGEKILFVPSSKVYHYGSATLGGKTSPLSLFYGERNFGLFVLKNFPMPYLLKFLPGFFFVKIWGFFKAIWSRCPMAFVRGNLSFIALLPKIPHKRRSVLSSSVLSSREFEGLLRKNWLREKIAYLKGNYDIPQ